MFSIQFIPFVIIGIITLIIFIRNVIKNKFSEKESILWAIAAFVMILSPFYMGYVDRFANFVGVNYPPALIFALLFVYVFFLLYRHSAAQHKLNETIVELIQQNAIYEKELRDLTSKASEQNPADNGNQDKSSNEGEQR